MPEEWIRKQTLAQAERYITQELKEYEEKILGADEKILVLEAQALQRTDSCHAGVYSADTDQCQPHRPYGLSFVICKDI
ncbi:MAG: hypothetical protein ACLRYB_00595 [Segatella copri]